ncbi:hypothetical protein [Sphingomonas faeni]|uniref:hypothetical protein n=1 Tax=Sphingomonas faeni TaxID=185950 RepID=UPI003364F035
MAMRMRALARVIVSRDPAGPAPRLEAASLQAGAISAERTAAMADAEANSAPVNAVRRIARDVFDQAAQYEAKRSALGKWDGNTPRSFADAANEAKRNFQLGAIPLAIYMKMQQSFIEATNAVLDERREAIEALL